MFCQKRKDTGVKVQFDCIYFYGYGIMRDSFGIYIQYLQNNMADHKYVPDNFLVV